MSDTEQEWKPSGKVRPQSTMAQAFSSALDNAFMLDSDVNHLSQTIDQKKQHMIIQSRELEALQARIREAEERLKSQSSHFTSASQTNESGRDHESAPQEEPTSNEHQQTYEQKGNES
ncbi:uncharacterized protein N7482_001730 [Penicillium canariense]|uniref:Uncharacterized protein n=1 Tax=Penicillium canariense TaxID=189055 RepID=A0A9W9IDY4_9EURO|nr:uncharacterized protein N7482_001730 [Penicillium canariense]KAJ5175853.1 hypothetical protein N7482_001730 [Penicillium canariense]